MTKHISLQATLLTAGFFLLAGATIYVSVRSSSIMSEISWIPHWLSAWADKNPDLRTAVPFFFLSLMCPATMGFSQPGKGAESPRLKRLWLIVGYSSIVIILVTTEASQLFIPTRFPNVLDILWGLAGVAAGGVAGVVAWQQLQQIRGRRTAKAAVGELH